MRNILSIEKLKETPTYQTLAIKKEIIKMGFLEKRATREIISNGFMVYKNTGIIPGNVTGTNLQIVKDLIGIDYMNNLNVNL